MAFLRFVLAWGAFDSAVMGNNAINPDQIVWQKDVTHKALHNDHTFLYGNEEVSVELNFS